MLAITLALLVGASIIFSLGFVSGALLKAILVQREQEDARNAPGHAGELGSAFNWPS